MASSLELPNLAERLATASDIAQLTPSQLRDRLRQIGVETGEKSLYKLFDGTTSNPPMRVLAGLTQVLHTGYRWWFELDNDQQLQRALSAYWLAIHRPDRANTAEAESSKHNAARSDQDRRGR